MLIAKAAEALEAGLSLSIDDKNAFALTRGASHYIQITDSQNGEIGNLHVVSTRGDRSDRLAWRDQFVPSPRWPDAIERHRRTVSMIDDCWSDGEEIDPVDRVVLEATYATHIARNGLAIGAASFGVPAAVTEAEELPASKGPLVGNDLLNAIQVDWWRHDSDIVVQSADRLDR